MLAEFPINVLFAGICTILYLCFDIDRPRNDL